MRIGAWILILFSCITCALSAYNLFNVFTHPMKFKTEIIANANDYNLSPELVASIINVESSFKHYAKSNKNAIGLMQIKLTTANYINELTNQEEINENQLFTPSINIRYGCAYFRYLIDKFDDINTSLAAYNAGETRVRSWLNSKTFSLDGKTLNLIPFEETKNYVKRINNNLKYYKKIFSG